MAPDAVLEERHGLVDASNGIRYGGKTDPAIVNEIFEARLGRRATPDEHAAFVGNAIALSPDTAWMSAMAERALTADRRAALAAAGFGVRSVPLDAVEAGGGSLRCCVGEVF